MTSLSVTILGAGDAFASRGRFQAAYVLKHGDLTVLLEAGPATLAAMKRQRISPAEVDVVLVSHLHGDHFAGLPFLILEYLYESPRQRTLIVAGPPGLEQRTLTLFRDMYPDSDYVPLLPYLQFVELLPGLTAQLLPGLRVLPVAVPHTLSDISLGYRVEMGNRVVGFTGDSGWTDDLFQLSMGVDLFLCECTYFESSHLTFHLNYPQIVENLARFGARRILLTHIGREVLDRQSEIDLEMADEGMVIDL